MEALLDNQVSAIEKLRRYKVGALFMDTGTGKTRTLIELVNGIDDIDMVLYVAPFSAINPPPKIMPIMNEVDKWGGFNYPVRYVGVESIGMSDRIYLEIRELLSKCKKPLIIVDESIKIKNSNAIRTQRLLDLSQFAEYKLIANATPITKDILDVWAQFEFLSPKILKMDRTQFENTFCKKTIITKRIGNKEHRNEFISGMANIDHLYSMIGHFVYESSLGVNIKKKDINIIYQLEYELKEEYKAIKESYLSVENLLLFNNNIFISMTQKLQHAYSCSLARLKAVKKYIKEEHRTVIYCKYIRSAEFCREHFPDALVLNYQKDSLSFNLQYDYSYMVFWDKMWDYYLVKQAKGRIERIGQTSELCYFNVNADVGLDLLIDKNVAKKTSQADYLKEISVEQLKNEL